MDVLRKELNSIYASQHLENESLDPSVLERCRQTVSDSVHTDNDCRVITDVASDKCYIYGGTFAALIGLEGADNGEYEIDTDSSDEDEVYSRMHPEDLVEKRIVEYEFFKTVDRMDDADKLDMRATCHIRIRRRDNDYMRVYNTTRVYRLSPAGKIWLILCTYDIASEQSHSAGLMPSIINCRTGVVTTLSVVNRRSRLLTQREKEVLILIRDGKPSKHIADILRISIHTVNRHRQNIIEKLSVGNSMEAVKAATEMGLLRL